MCTPDDPYREPPNHIDWIDVVGVLLVVVAGLTAWNLASWWLS